MAVLRCFRTIGLLLFTLLCLGDCGAILPKPDADGKYTIEAEGIRASFIEYGASVTNLYVRDRRGIWRDIVLGYDNATTYETDPIHPNYGAIPGRYANRIPNATYVLDGQRRYTQRNNANSTIHSGTNGWSYRKWTFDWVTASAISFSLSDDSDSSEGFPGLVVAKVTYTLSKMAWSINIEAEAIDRDSPIMATSHAYWNLDAFQGPDATVLDYTFSLPFSKRMVKFAATSDGKESEPNGELPAIPRGDINDFWSAPKKLGASSGDARWTGNCGPGVPGYDCQWIVDRSAAEERAQAQRRGRPVATLRSAWSGIGWAMYSNQAGVVMTTCGFFPPGLLPLKKTQATKGNGGFVPRSGCVAVEAQDWTGGIDFPQWGRRAWQVYGPTTERYENSIVYEFSVE